MISSLTHGLFKSTLFSFCILEISGIHYWFLTWFHCYQNILCVIWKPFPICWLLGYDPDMVCLSKWSECTWEECVFCCSWVEGRVNLLFKSYTLPHCLPTCSINYCERGVEVTTMVVIFFLFIQFCYFLLPVFWISVISFINIEWYIFS